MVKCETVDLEVPANAEIVLEGRLKAVEGWVHDEGQFGEFTGMYGGGLKHNIRAEFTAITYRKNGIFQYATIGGGHPWFTDNMLQNPAVEADLFGALKDSALDVLDVRAPAGGVSNIAYAKIRKQGAGDGKQALAVMLSGSKMAIPKLAYVFDEDVDIWDDHEVQWALAFRYNPIVDTLILPGMNTMTVDPTIPASSSPGTISKIGFDCTINQGPEYDPDAFTRSQPFVLGDPPADLKPMTEDQITQEMESFIREQPRSFKEIVEHFNGQNYRDFYRAFGNLRPRLGRVTEGPMYPYTFSDDGDFVGPHPQTPESPHDPKHHPA